MKSLTAAFLLLVLLGSCTSRRVEPTRSSRHTIDTLFSQKIIELKPEMDSVCGAYYNNIYSAAVDSIRKVRDLEMKTLVE